MFAVRSTDGGTVSGLVSMSQEPEQLESASGAVCTKLKMLQDAVVKMMLYEQQRCIGAYYEM